MGTATDRDGVIVLGRDRVGTVAESMGCRYYLTECCGATAKGLEDCIGCRSCYSEVDPMLGDVPDKRMVWDPNAAPADRIRFEPRPIDWIEVYGDGLPYDEWKARYVR